MTYLRENPLDTSATPDPKMRADRMLHALEHGIDVARRLADSGIDGDGAEDRETLLHRLIWTLDRVSEAEPPPTP